MRSSTIAGTNAGFDVTHPLSDTLSLYGGGDVRYRNVLQAANYTSEQLDLRGGASYAIGANLLRGGLTLQGFRQRTDVPTADRNALGVNVEWRHTFSARDQGSLFAVGHPPTLSGHPGQRRRLACLRWRLAAPIRCR